MLGVDRCRVRRGLLLRICRGTLGIVRRGRLLGLVGVRLGQFLRLDAVGLGPLVGGRLIVGLRRGLSVRSVSGSGLLLGSGGVRIVRCCRPLFLCGGFISRCLVIVPGRPGRRRRGGLCAEGGGGFEVEAVAGGAAVVGVDGGGDDVGAVGDEVAGDGEGEGVVDGAAGADGLVGVGADADGAFVDVVAEDFGAVDVEDDAVVGAGGELELFDDGGVLDLELVSVEGGQRLGAEAGGEGGAEGALAPALGCGAAGPGGGVEVGLVPVGGGCGAVVEVAPVSTGLDQRGARRVFGLLGRARGSEHGGRGRGIAPGVDRPYEVASVGGSDGEPGRGVLDRRHDAILHEDLVGGDLSVVR